MPDIYPESTNSGVASKIITDIASLANPVLGRLANAGLLPGGRRRQNNVKEVTTSVVYMDEQYRRRNWKVSIKLGDNNRIFYNSLNPGIMAPLLVTNGVVYPYTPQISVNHQATYNQQKFTHSNYLHMAYDGSEVQQIQVSGEFTAQDHQEASYILAVIYFFRAATKMFFGQGDNIGNPPPLVYLNGYGEMYFPNVPCVITRFSHTMPSDVDYIETSTVNLTTKDSYTIRQGNGEETIPARSINTTTRIPVISTISCDLQPVYSKSNLTQFNLNDFAQGKLVERGFI